MSPQLRRSFAWCERLTRSRAGNFYPAFRLLPRRQCLDMCSLYAFLRVADDLTDEPGDADVKRLQLDTYRAQLDDALAGAYRHPLHAAFIDTVRLHNIPTEYLHAALDGVGMDLDTDHYDTFADLYSYCYRVASVVGLACIHIWGFTDRRAIHYAEAAGLALQLTNILRDLGEDVERGRVYLPQEDLHRFHYNRDLLKRGERTESYLALMRFEAQRARAYYEEAALLAPLLRPAGRAVFLVLLRTYRGLLEEIIASDFDVFNRRIRVSGCFKLWQVLRAVPVRLGVTPR